MKIPSRKSMRVATALAVIGLCALLSACRRAEKPKTKVYLNRKSKAAGPYRASGAPSTDDSGKARHLIGQANHMMTSLEYHKAISPLTKVDTLNCGDHLKQEAIQKIELCNTLESVVGSFDSLGAGRRRIARVVPHIGTPITGIVVTDQDGFIKIQRTTNVRVSFRHADLIRTDTLTGNDAIAFYRNLIRTEIKNAPQDADSQLKLARRAHSLGLPP
jgi:hypothetical protein